MPVKKKSLSVLKRMRQTVRKAEYRGRVRTTSRTLVRKARTLINAGATTGTEEALRLAIRALDKAAEKGVIHKNNAARRKSRLMKAMNKTREQK